MEEKLHTEFEFYKKHQAEFVQKYNGKYIVIVGESVFDVYDTIQDAYTKPQEKLKLGEFLIHLVGPGEDNYTQTFHSRAIFR